MPSLQHIADHVGVSKSLVSKVLNDHLGNTRIRPEVMEKIRHAAAELGYRKNLSAAALSAGCQNTVGVFIQAPGVKGSGIVEGLVDGLSAASLEIGKKLLLSFFHGPDEFEPLRALIHRNVMDGVVVGGFCHPRVAKALLAVQRGGLPMVTAFKRPVSRTIPNVGVPQEAITRLATEHLIERGCRRIAHIYDTDERLRGYREALEQHGLGFAPERVYNGPDRGFSYERGEQAVAHLLTSCNAFDGLVAQSDEEAIGAVNALRAAGRRVPDNVRVTGVDDAVYCRYCVVPITSVSERVEEQGATAMRMLAAVLRGEDVQSRWLEPHLHARRSSD